MSPIDRPENTFEIDNKVAFDPSRDSNFKMAEEHTTLNEEKLTQLIRKIFQEEFKKQEVHITNIISSNFKITMEEIKKSQEQIKELKKEVTDLKSSIEHTDADLNDPSDRLTRSMTTRWILNMSQIN